MQHASVHALPEQCRRRAFRACEARQADPYNQAAIPRVRLGFFGVIDERMDLNLLAGVAAYRPDWHMILSARGQDRSGAPAAGTQHPLPWQQGIRGAAGMSPDGTSRCCPSPATRRPASSARQRRRSTSPPASRSSRHPSAMSCGPMRRADSCASPTRCRNSSTLSRRRCSTTWAGGCARWTPSSVKLLGTARGRACTGWSTRWCSLALARTRKRNDHTRHLGSRYAPVLRNAALNS